MKNASSGNTIYSKPVQEARNWQISLLSARASHWFEGKFARGSEDSRVLETDLAGANAFIRKARIDGYRTEYIGPIARSYF